MGSRNHIHISSSSPNRSGGRSSSLSGESLSICTLDDISMYSNTSRTKGLLLGWFIIVGGHIAVYIGSVFAMIMAIIHEPWYLSCIFTLFFFSPALAGFFCAFTNMENYFRGKLGWEIIPDDFASFYMRKWQKRGIVLPIMFKESK